MIRYMRREQGTVSAMMVVLSVFLMILAGLVVDGGNVLNARQRAVDDAEQAARRGANQIDLELLRAEGEVVVQWPQAGLAARDYLTARDYAAEDVSVVPLADGSVEVTVSRTIEPQLLSLAMIPPITVTGRAVARPAIGITQEI